MERKSVDEMRQYLIRINAWGLTMDELLQMSNCEIRSMYNQIKTAEEDTYGEAS